MRKIIILVCLGILCGACAPKKPELTPTQVVDGRSIVVPPEFDVIPDQSITEKGN